MAMVRQLTEGELMNGSTPEDDSRSSDHLDCYNSHSASHSSSGSKRNTPVFLPSLQYSKEDLMKYSSLPLSQNRPSCLDTAYNNPSGKWDPERWFMNHRSDRVPSGDDSRSKRERQEDSIVSHKRKSSDPKERIKEEKDDIVLSPQRRSFGTGCHVIQQSSLARRPGSPTDGRDSENYRDPSRRIGSGRIMTRDRDQRDWERDREYGYSSSNRNDRRDRFDQDDSEKDIRRYSNRYNRNDRRSRGRDRIDEVEPEWFSGGPTSQSETIELVGFEEQQNEDDNRKPKKIGKRAKQNSRRSSLKSEEGEKVENVLPDEVVSHKKVHLSQEEQKPVESKIEVEEHETNKSNNAGFDLDDLFRMEWIPGLLQNESPPNNMGNEMGCSRFSQWFKRDSPQPESANNSRRSSLHEELIANVLNSIAEPQLIIPSPTPNSSDAFFAPISPALSHSTSFSASQSLASGCNSNKDIMDMLQSVNSSCDSALNGGNQKDSKSVKELEADLKRIVLGENKQERSAFDKLLQHMSESRNSPASSLSIGPLDKSKALQEQDLLQDMLGDSHTSSVSPVIQPFQMLKEDKPVSQLSSGMSRNQFAQLNQPNQNEIFAHLVQQHPKQQDPQLSHLQQLQMQQQQIQNHLQQQQQQQQSQHMNVHGFPADMLAKIFGSSQAPVSPVSPGLHQSSSAPSLSQNDTMNSVLQYQRQQELLSSILKQQHSAQNVSQSTLMQRRQRPSTKEIPMQQTLGLPTLGISPRQSPLPPDAVSSAISSQGRIPSPLVFGQQPPALSHAPAPIHPAVVQAMAQQNAANSNTLQVQNPVVLQRVPSPQELAVHTQSILQNALIKRKLEEQKENFRKRQEAQRTISPVTSNKNGMTVSPLKGLSPTIAFTPTSVMRKIQSEKTENKEQKNVTVQNGNKMPADLKSDSSSNNQKMNPGAIPVSSVECGMNAVSCSNQVSYTQSSTNIGQVPRALHGQSNSQPRSIHGNLNSLGSSISIPNQGRPIVKVGMNQTLNSNPELSRSNMTKSAMAHNKQFLPGSGQAHNFLHDTDPGFDSMAKFPWQHQLARPQNTSTMPPLQMAATYAALNHRPSALSSHHHNLLRPVNIASSANVSTPNLNFPLMRNPVQNPIRGLSLQLQRGAIDSRQLQALAQSQRLHPATIQQLLMNSQNQVSAAQAQIVAGFSGNRDSKHQHLLPGQSSTNRQSPVNLAKWFGNDVLKQKMPEMPPVSHQKALLVEEVERQQQQSTAVHN